MIPNNRAKGTKRRETSQRLIILSYLKATREHPTAEEVYAAVRKKLPNISLATVYRNLNLMAWQGLIIRISLEGECRYDAFTQGHIHVVLESGKVVDICNKRIPEMVKAELARKGFACSRVTITATAEKRKR
ncbi:MAG: transcriptional repressor [Nanoarchaeota archaeon]